MPEKGLPIWRFDCRKSPDAELTLKPIAPDRDRAPAEGPEPTTELRGALASLSLSMLLSSLGISIANVALPTLAHALNASFQQVQWIVLAYLLAITTLIVSVG